jgi:hypothetical protein
MRRGDDRKFVLTVLLVLAASLSASILMDSPTGMQGIPTNQPESSPALGNCYTQPYDPYPFTTTLTNCCQSTLPNYRWESSIEEVFC